MLHISTDIPGADAYFHRLTTPQLDWVAPPITDENRVIWRATEQSFSHGAVTLEADTSSVLRAAEIPFSTAWRAAQQQIAQAKTRVAAAAERVMKRLGLERQGANQNQAPQQQNGPAPLFARHANHSRLRMFQSTPATAAAPAPQTQAPRPNRYLLRTMFEFGGHAALGLTFGGLPGATAGLMISMAIRHSNTVRPTAIILPVTSPTQPALRSASIAPPRYLLLTTAQGRRVRCIEPERPSFSSGIEKRRQDQTLELAA